MQQRRDWRYGFAHSKRYEWIKQKLCMAKQKTIKQTRKHSTKNRNTQVIIMQGLDRHSIHIGSTKYTKKKRGTSKHYYYCKCSTFLQYLKTTFFSIPWKCYQSLNTPHPITVFRSSTEGTTTVRAELLLYFKNTLV